jgi:hypothetical protein
VGLDLSSVSSAYSSRKGKTVSLSGGACADESPGFAALLKFAVRQIPEQGSNGQFPDSALLNKRPLRPSLLAVIKHLFTKLKLSSDRFLTFWHANRFIDSRCYCL